MYNVNHVCFLFQLLILPMENFDLNKIVADFVNATSVKSTSSLLKNSSTINIPLTETLCVEALPTNSSMIVHLGNDIYAVVDYSNNKV